MHLQKQKTAVQLTLVNAGIGFSRTMERRAYLRSVASRGGWSMNSIVSPISNGIILYCPKLCRSLSGLTNTAIVQLDAPSTDLFLSTRLDGSVTALPNAWSEATVQTPGPLLSCQEISGCDAALLRLAVETRQRTAASATGDQSWHMFSCKFENGIEDRFAVLLAGPAEAGAARGFLSTIWPVLREDCLRDARPTTVDVCDKAMQWMAASRVDVAIFIMNSKGAMLRSNSAAMQLLDDETVLSRTPDGICCNNVSQTKKFRTMLADCVTSDPRGPEKVMFLDAEAPAVRVPVTMARFWHDGAATDLVTVMVPMPPDSRRVEMLARAVGLTPAEARIASLMQMGLSNKDAAKVVGLKEQSVSTYAKRVLSKLNVTSRAEMAQMLTWQSAGGRTQ